MSATPRISMAYSTFFPKETLELPFDTAAGNTSPELYRHPIMASSLQNQPLIDTTRDGHVHTCLCGHASGTMEEYVQAAVAKGLSSLTFLDHMEGEIRYPYRSWLTADDFTVYWAEGERLRKKYAGQVEVRLGVEMGYNPDGVETLRRQLGAYPWASVGLSCHFFRHGDRHYNLLSNRRESLEMFTAIGVDTVLQRYFSILIDGVQQLNCTVLCHLDAGLRHMPGIRFSEEHREQIHTLLQAVRSRGMALEINASGFDYRGNPFPADWIITTAIGIGIPLAPGSDAHRPEEVGRHFDRLPSYVEALRP